VGSSLKIVFASTQGQEDKVEELARHFYCEVLPLYFTDEDIREFERLEVLHTTRDHFENFSTLGDAFRVITSLQTMISILESRKVSERYRTVFQKNADTLREFGIYFPFQFQHFLDARSTKEDYISIYTKAANSILA
jgi:hypothetical protein